MTTHDGPWRVADRLRVIAATEDVGRSVAERLAQEGLSILDAEAMTLEAWTASAWSGGPARDWLVLDARTRITAAAVSDLRRAADGDPMIVAAMPRFGSAPDDLVAGAGPALSYGLLADRRCLYVKGSVLRGIAIERDPAEREIEDLLLSFNRFGFRIVTVDGAPAIHPEGARPATRKAPIPAAWRPAAARRAASAPALADRLIESLRPGPDGRRRVAFDLSHLAPRHSGTTMLASALLRRAVPRWPDLSLHVVARSDAFAFHFADLAPAVTRIDPSDPAVFAASIRFGQPFLWGEVESAARRAPVLVLFLLDAIGLDCQRDAPDELDALWRFVLAEADGLLFNSAFTRRQFARRFSVRPDMPAVTSLHSLDLADYCGGGGARDAAPRVAGDGRRTVLVIGNTLPHKYLRETAMRLAGADLGLPIVVLGLPPGMVAGIEALSSGDISPERMADLYRAAEIVVYPSLYEGFGFPILEALAHRRPVLVRPLAPFAEIVAGLPEAANIHTFADDEDLLRLVRDPPRWTEARAAVAPRTWDHAADDLRAVLDAALLGVSHARVVRRIDVLRGRMMFMRARAIRGSPGDGDGDGDDVDRMAGLAGRLAQSAVAALGRGVPGGRALARAAARVLRDRR